MKPSDIFKKKGFTPTKLIVFLAVLLVGGGIGFAVIMALCGKFSSHRHHRSEISEPSVSIFGTTFLQRRSDGDRVKAAENMKRIFNELQRFKTEYGDYPCDQTAELLQEQQPDLYYGELTGDTSNAYFRQLFYGREKVNEGIFYANLAVEGAEVKEGDNLVGNGKALEQGENAMAYVMKKDIDDPDLKRAVTNSSTPLVFCSVYPSKTPYTGDTIVLDNASFSGQVMVLNTDGSLITHKDNVEEDDVEDDKATFKESIFPKTRRGRDTAPDHVVLPPDL